MDCVAIEIGESWSGDSPAGSNDVYDFGLLIRRSTVRICQDPPLLSLIGTVNPASETIAGFFIFDSV